MRICSHVVMFDTGLAPNPFHGFCTSAVCTPSHTNSKIEVGDRIVGNSAKSDGNRLVYAMLISDILPLDRYFLDPRFAAKKPKPNGSAEERCGDNIYFRDAAGEWRRLASPYHNHPDEFRKDVGRGNRRVFVAERFHYFGRNRVEIPDEFSAIVHRTQGKHFTGGPVAEAFAAWVGDYEEGVLGKPRDLEACGSPDPCGSLDPSASSCGAGHPLRCAG